MAFFSTKTKIKYFFLSRVSLVTIWSRVIQRKETKKFQNKLLNSQQKICETCLNFFCHLNVKIVSFIEDYIKLKFHLNITFRCHSNITCHFSGWFKAPLSLMWHFRALPHPFPRYIVFLFFKKTGTSVLWRSQNLFSQILVNF